MRTKLTGFGYVPHRPRRRKTRGMFTEIEIDVAVAIKKLAISLDVSCASVINGILRRSLKLHEGKGKDRT
jgi:hypothetical protein